MGRKGGGHKLIPNIDLNAAQSLLKERTKKERDYLINDKECCPYSITTYTSHKSRLRSWLFGKELY